jgi:lipoyl(octanoyl) transferase
MNARRADCSSRSGVAVWLAGTIGLDAYGAMAERLSWEVSEPHGRPPTLVLYDLAPSITIGRLGSRADIDLSDDELRSRRLEVRFVGRGGGAVLHGPGQIGIALFQRLDTLLVTVLQLANLLAQFLQVVVGRGIPREGQDRQGDGKRQ